MGFSYLDHGADMGIEAESDTLNGLFEQSARGLFSLMVNLNDVELEKTSEVKSKGSTHEELLYEWLSELVSLSNLKNEVYSDFEDLVIEESNSGFRIQGLARGEKMDPEAHELGTEVKGVTYQGLEVTLADDTWRCRFVVDV